MDKKAVLYWIPTGLFLAAMLGGGMGNLLRSESMHAEVTGLGYPEYLLTILGVAKLLGVAAIAWPGFPRLKEWAYAGFTFDLLGAAVSHAFMGDPIFAVGKPLIVLTLGLSSRALQPEPEPRAQAAPSEASTAAH